MTGKISDDADIVVDGTEKVAVAKGGQNYGPLVTSIATYLASLVQTLTNKNINAANNTISNLATAMFAANVIDTDGSLSANSDTRIASQKAVKAYADTLIAANDAMVFKGVIDCSGNPNYPAADRGWTYKVSVAGKIGGASGVVVEAGDMAICITDGTVSGNQATVGANWVVTQANIDGAVTGPVSSTSGNLATFNGTAGKTIQDSGVAISTDGTLASNSDNKVPTEKAVKAYAASSAANRVINPTGAVAQFLPQGSATVTMTIASPGVVTWTGHTFSNGSKVALATTGALPTGLAAGTVYYMVNAATNTFQLAATPGGAAINTSGTQSGTHTAYAAAADVDYDFDKWNALTQTAAVAPSQVLNAENTTPFLMRLTQSASAAQRMGRIQWIESADCIDLRGQACMLAARVRMSASTTLRFAILEWDGTADSIGASKDVVNDWTSATFTAGNFFSAGSLAVVATGSQALTANTFADVSLAGTIGSSANNLAVFFWTDSTQAQGVTLDIAKVRLIPGTVVPAFQPRPYDIELGLCQGVYVPLPVGGFFGGGTVRGTGTDFYAYMAVPGQMKRLPAMTFVGMQVVVGDTLRDISSASISKQAGNMLTLSVSTGTSAGSAGQALVFYNATTVNSIGCRL